MTDQTTQGGKRLMALAHLRILQVKRRATTARQCLRDLRNLHHQIHPDDRALFALDVWREFAGSDGRALDMPLGVQAGVFAQVAPWLSEEQMLNLARVTWGDMPVEDGEGLDSVMWLPDDEVLIVNATHPHLDGSTGRATFVVRPMRMPEAGA